MFSPLPIFWTVNAQSDSRWTFQAKRMNGDIGFYHLKPDQIQMVSSPFLLILIPLMETVGYPFLRRFGVRRPLQKMAIGGMISAVAFLMAGILQLLIEASPKNAIHMLWQLPQYFVLTIGEVMFQVIGNEANHILTIQFNSVNKIVLPDFLSINRSRVFIRPSPKIYENRYIIILAAGCVAWQFNNYGFRVKCSYL